MPSKPAPRRTRPACKCSRWASAKRSAPTISLKVVAPSGGSLLGERAADRLEVRVRRAAATHRELRRDGRATRRVAGDGRRARLDLQDEPGAPVHRRQRRSRDRREPRARHRVLVPRRADPTVCRLRRGEIARGPCATTSLSRGRRGAMTELSIVSRTTRAEVANPEVVRAQARAQLAALENSSPIPKRAATARSQPSCSRCSERSAAGNTASPGGSRAGVADSAGRAQRARARGNRPRRR